MKSIRTRNLKPISRFSRLLVATLLVLTFGCSKDVAPLDHNKYIDDLEFMTNKGYLV